jgi:IS5 family transposase
VSGPVEITHEELALILEALDDAAFYRDARSRIVESAVRRRSRGESPLVASGANRESHQRKVQAYNALAVKLRQRLGKD